MLQKVTFKWSTEDGFCYDCGLPAAFWSPDKYGETEMEPLDESKLCAVCAANDAAGGLTIRRIKPLELRVDNPSERWYSMGVELTDEQKRLRALWFATYRLSDSEVENAPEGTILEDVAGRVWEATGPPTDSDGTLSPLRWACQDWVAADGYVADSFVVQLPQ